MPYFHKTICISPQNSFPEPDFSGMRESVSNLLEVIEPEYPGIPAGARRRMGKSVRMAVGAALPLLQIHPQPDGILIATANGGMEDCIKFLNQILEYNEGLLSPTSFVQSTSNAAAAQIALVTKNHSYNVTHVHRGLAFENALLDVVMLLKEKEDAGYLLGCTDEISAYNYNIDRIAGCYRSEPVLNSALFEGKAAGTIAGEGAFMVWVDNEKTGALAKMESVKTVHTPDPDRVVECMKKFIAENFEEGGMPDLLLTGENGDQRLLHYYEAVEQLFPSSVTVGRFKHLCGEYCTASSFAGWLSIQILQTGRIPAMLIKKTGSGKLCERILV